MTKNTVYEHWHEYTTRKKPRYVKMYGGKRGKELHFELGLIFPNQKWSTKTYVRDDLGRNVEAKFANEKYRIKELIPYWDEETIYDHDRKKRIRYHELLEIITGVQEIAQIFTLNNKLFLQVENDVRMFGNKNVFDAKRLFELIRSDIIKNKYDNFIFVKDINTYQRSYLYEMLESKGYKRSELFRHYSY